MSTFTQARGRLPAEGEDHTGATHVFGSEVRRANESSSGPGGSHGPRIFINYRRDDAAGDAGRLHDALVARFGKASIFMDIDKIQPGADFAEVINDAVGSCEVLVSVIGKTWLSQSDDGGRRRLDDERDLVRLEIQSALGHKIRLVPVLVQGAQMPRAAQLPAGLAGLARKNSFELSYTRWQYDVERLIRALEGSTTLGEASVHNLPRQLTSFVGRGDDVAAAQRTLSTARLLTLTGTGGVGKTRLAIQVAGELVNEFRDGVWLVELAPIADPALVTQALAVALGVREQSGREIAETVSGYLRPRQALLVLDNCEHLVEAVARLVEGLLRACPELRILATSREALGIGGEAVSRVRSLSVPDAAGQPVAAGVADYEAVALFCDRATTAVGSFVLTPKTAPLVVQICRRLDGIPLAIELAAARLKVLSLDQIVERLDNRFQLLTGGSRTALPRQKTLRATIDWSYELLPSAERAVLRRLSVFAGGASLEAAEAVCAGDIVEAGQVLDLLSELTSKSLVQVEDSGGAARYQLLETIRQYGEDHLREPGEAAALRQRHSDWFQSLAERAELELKGPEQLMWSELLEIELENLRAAFEWSLQAGDTEAGLRFATSLGRFWYVRGHPSEGQDWLNRTLAHGEGSARLRAQAVGWAAQLASYMGDDESATRLGTESLDQFRRISDQRGVGFALGILGLAAIGQDEYEQAVALEEESLAALNEAGDKADVAQSLFFLGQAYLQVADYQSAVGRLEEALALFRELGDKRFIALSIGVLGRVALNQRNYGQAASLLEEGLTLLRDLKDQGRVTLLLALSTTQRCLGNFEVAKAMAEESLASFRRLGQIQRSAYSLCELGIIARLEGNFERAAGLLLEGLTLTRDRYGAAIFLEAVAGVACGQGQLLRGVTLFGAAQATRENIDLPLDPYDVSDHEAIVAAAKADLGEEEFGKAWNAGYAMTQDAAIALARAGETS